MRPIEIDPARGFDTSVDPRVAPDGAIARVENMRIDKLGRLQLRAGYQSLGVTTQDGGGSLVPFDLHALDDELIALGNHSSVNQTGIRAAYKYVNNAQGAWRTEPDISGAIDTSAGFSAICAADNVSILYSDATAVITDKSTVDIAITADGVYLGLAGITFDEVATTSTRLTVLDAATGKVLNISGVGLEENPRILAIGQVFYLFTQTGTTINVRTLNMANANPTISGATAVATGTSALPASYDVANYAGTTDYLIAFPTGTGYTWRRFNSANVQQTTTNVASLADAPVSICGATGENISVLNVRTTSGAELRTFTTATGVLAVGPTNLDTSGSAMVWVSLVRFSATQVYARWHRTATSIRTFQALVTIAAHAITALQSHDETKPTCKSIIVDGNPFTWETLGISPAPYGLIKQTAFTSGTGASSALAAVALNGIAKTVFSAATQGKQSNIVRGTGSVIYAMLMALDPRDKSYRAHVVSCEVFSGKRRQAAALNGSLYLAGGLTTQYDLRLAYEVGFDISPVILSLSSSLGGGGALTALGTYTMQIVYRAVEPNGNVTQSAPSPPATRTLAGADNQLTWVIYIPYTARAQSRVAFAVGTQVYCDVYRTEAGGSIPRLTKSILIGAGSFGGQLAGGMVDGVSDAIQQTGRTLYTQGADGSVSGRLPLSLASPARLIAESEGRLVLGGLERENEMQLSIEGRPGEAMGFVNDDLFFIQNPEPVTAIQSGKDARRFVFGRNLVRQLLGSGPNSAGIGDISEPVEIESRVGAVDWRSLAKTEHGVFFQTSVFGEPRIYLLPDGGGSAIDASLGVRDLLAAFPVIVSATRHDEEQLLTFALQNAAGTDGRLLHLDLLTSGMTRNGWQGRWIIDRVAALEGVADIEIVEESIQVLTAPATTGTTVLSFAFPRGGRLGDRIVYLTSVEAPVAGTTFVSLSSATLRASNTANSVNQSFVHETFLNSLALAAASQTGAAAQVTLGPVAAPTVVMLKTWLLRGAHASQALEASSVGTTSTTSFAVPALAPTWGSARNLWLTSCIITMSGGSADASAVIIRGYPAGYARATHRRATNAADVTTLTEETAYASRLLDTTSQTLTWTTVTTQTGMAWTIAVRPLAGGSPPRATERYQGRLVVCNATDVMRSTPGSFADLSATVGIKGEWESCDIYPQGPGGAGRHLAVHLIGELIGFCAVYAALSYDGGVNWTDLKSHFLTVGSGYAEGQVVKLTWVPRRRKIDGVRLKIVVMEDPLGTNQITGGLAINRVRLWFEDLAGLQRPSAGANAPRK